MVRGTEDNAAIAFDDMNETSRIKKKVRVKQKKSFRDNIASKTRWQPLLLVTAVAAGILLGVYILFRYME